MGTVAGSTRPTRRGHQRRPGQPLSRPQLALRDLQLLDGALAETARWADVPVTDLDTVPAGRGVS